MNKKTPFVTIMVLAVLLGQFSPVPQPVRAAACDAVLFVADVTVPDGSAYSPNAAFTKTWRLKNIGSCTWTTDYKLVFASGAQMGGPAETALAASVAPNATVDLSVSLTAPVPAGAYRGYWQLKNASGTPFGIGANADKPFWVAIVTRPGSAVTPMPVGESYNFATQAGQAQNWMSGAGLLSFPGTDGDARGFAQKLDSVVPETGVTVNLPTLLMVPQNKTDGYIQGLYPSLAIQSGDRFQATIGCQSGATTCFVTYRIDARTSTGTRTLWSFREKFDRLTYNVDLDLSALAGKNVEFFLLVLASGSPVGDRALWINPRIARNGVSNPPTATPTVSGTPPTATATSTGPTSTPIPNTGPDKALFVADVTVPDGTTFNPGSSFVKVWRLKNVGSSTWSTSYKLVFVSGDQMSGPLEVPLAASVAPNATVDLSVNLMSPAAGGHYRGFWMLKNASGNPFGIGPAGNAPFWVDIIVNGSGPSATPTLTLTPVTATATATSAAPTATPFNGNWLLFTNTKYQFHFQYPPDAQLSGLQDNAVRLDLPFVPGTNLGEKYLSMAAVEGVTSCTGLLTVNPPTTSGPVTINGIVFTKQTGTDENMSQLYQWTNYFTVKGNVCVSMGFLLHSAVPGVVPTETPQFNPATESAVFDQIMSTFGWDTP